MATATSRALQKAENTGEAISDNLTHQIAALRKQVDQLSHSVHSYSDHSMSDLQHNAVAIAREVQHQGRAVARQVSKQANATGEAVRENPVPVVLALGTIALLSALVFTRR
ncbi:hypothetical protein PSC71_14165 [Devosia sp. J2-20]|jgi:ElaB/YqjD/DUF883 family membrane-anchored ribosome-binding protein|uniref:DUF883 domain-containing protein n=1 Tax=Devosia litorisediminis TaxID=2829817 RepID=A0A942IDS4_9HYPH|nr:MULTISPECIES: hypothetical protein [Devosia]MBS3848590.1 hypothetical protein [Devosia litorisediminis]WDQ98357.1 hypothetical protein PSC71_14165 [Devosia sp. J2-20]